MHIAFFGTRVGLDPSLLGGIESMFRRLAAALGALGCRVDYVVSEAGCNEVSDLAPNVTVYRFRASRAALHHVLSQAYDVVHLGNVSWDVATRLLSQRRSYILAYTYHIWSSSWLRAFLRDLVTRSAVDRVFAVSWRLAERLRTRGIDAKLLLPPVTQEFFASQARRPRGRLNVGYVGRIAADKGVAPLLRAWEQIRRLYPERVQFTVAGYYHATDRTGLALNEAICRKTWIDFRPVALDGYTRAAEHIVAELLQDLDILMLPYSSLTRTVDLPLVLLEAMAAGTVVLTTPLGDIPRLVASPAQLLSSLDPQALQSALYPYLQDPTRVTTDSERAIDLAKRLGIHSSAVAARYLEILKSG